MTIASRTTKTNLRRHVERRPQEYALCFVGLTGRVKEPSRLVESVDRREPAEQSAGFHFPARSRETQHGPT